MSIQCLHAAPAECERTRKGQTVKLKERGAETYRRTVGHLHSKRRKKWFCTNIPTMKY